MLPVGVRPRSWAWIVFLLTLTSVSFKQSMNSCWRDSISQTFSFPIFWMAADFSSLLNYKEANFARREKYQSLLYRFSAPFFFWRCTVLNSERLQEDPSFPSPRSLVISSDPALWQPATPGSHPSSLPKKPIPLVGLDPVTLKEPHTSLLPSWISSDFWRTGASMLSISRWSHSYGLLIGFGNPLAGREGYEDHTAFAELHRGSASPLGDLISRRLMPFYPRAQAKQDQI